MPNRRSIRLKGYDYSQKGAYFVTLCAYNRKCLFGDIFNDEMHFSKAGEIVVDEWIKTAKIRQEVELDTFVVMPNHFHAIVWLLCSGDQRRENKAVSAEPVVPTKKFNQSVGPQSQSIGAIMAGFKSAVTKRINEYRNTPGRPFWQRNYYEHVIRNEDDLNEVRQYIMNHPQKWMEDEENPVNLKCLSLWQN